MSEAVLTHELTTEEFLDLPDDERVERVLIQGELFEEPRSERNTHHSRLTQRGWRQGSNSRGCLSGRAVFASREHISAWVGLLLVDRMDG